MNQHLNNIVSSQENIMSILENLTETLSLENNHLDCPVYTNTSSEWIDSFNFWVSGVMSTCIAIPGLIGKYLEKIISFQHHSITKVCLKK